MVTRTAILSDVHGNAVALRAVLAELDSEAIDRGVSLGDVCQGGPEPAACVDLLAERGWPAVLGNTDAFVLDLARGEGPVEGLDERLLTVREWTYDQLGSARREIVSAYEPAVQLDLGGRRTLLGCHATPASYDSIVLPVAPEAEFRAAFGGTSADVVACGHVHRPYLRRLGETLVLNPGSIGLSCDPEQDEAAVRFDPWASWAVVTTEADRIAVEFRCTPFDVRALVDAYEANGIPFGEETARSWLAR